MRKLTVALLFVIAILLAGRFWQELNSIANAGGDDPISTILNGDVNGDQTLDMSDAVYLLVYLFNGGPDPVAFGDSPGLVDRVARLEERVVGQRTLTPEERAMLDHLSLVIGLNETDSRHPAKIIFNTPCSTRAVNTIVFDK